MKFYLYSWRVDQSVTVSLLYSAENFIVRTVQEPQKAIFSLKYLNEDQKSTASHTNFEIKSERTGNDLDQPSYLRWNKVGLEWAVPALAQQHLEQGR